MLHFFLLHWKVLSTLRFCTGDEISHGNCKKQTKKKYIYIHIKPLRQAVMSVPCMSIYNSEISLIICRNCRVTPQLNQNIFRISDDSSIMCLICYPKPFLSPGCLSRLAEPPSGRVARLRRRRLLLRLWGLPSSSEK